MFKNIIICIGCGESQRNLILASQELGYSILGIDKKPIEIASIDKLRLSTHDTELVINALGNNNRHKYLGVICQSSGVALRTAEKVAEMYQLHRVGSLITECSISKYKLFKEMEKRNIATIKCKAESKWDENNIRTGMIIKPDISRYGKKNVGRLQNLQDGHKLFNRAKHESLNQKVVLQEYIEGSDLGICAASLNGSILWYCFYRERNILRDSQIFPQQILMGEGAASQEELELIKLNTANIVKECNSSGFIFMTYRLNRQMGPLIYEINPGLCGDNLADKILPGRYHNHNFYKTEIELKLGFHPKLPQHKI